MTENTNNVINEMFKVGAHFGYSKTKRHPSTKPFIFGVKNKIEIIDLEKTGGMLDAALEFVKKIAADGKKVLIVGNKPDVKEIVKTTATRASLPYVAERWIGGTLTNHDQIKKRTSRLTFLKEEKAKGGLDKYTKKEQTVLAKEASDLERFFSGIVSMERTPGVVFVIDSDTEKIAVTEARKMRIPVISISNSDCDIRGIDYPIIANDNTQTSVKYFIDKIADAYIEGQKAKVKVQAAQKTV